MSSKGKGKAVAFSDGEKRKRGGGEDKGKTGGGRRKRNREILQFFEDEADAEDYDSGDSDDLDFGIDDFMDEELDAETKVNSETVKPPNLLFVKEEEMDEEEYDKMMEERFNNNPVLRAYADETKRIMERDSCLPCAKDPTLWKVKCIVGRERHSAFCLMQKFVDLKSLGTKLQIVSAFSVDHVKGFIFIEAYKQCDINEASKGLSGIYASRLSTVPLNERSHLLTVRNNRSPITKGMWARLKNGKYKGDLAQIIAVNDKRRVATVKLIPRIDLQAMALKFGGGVAVKNASTPAPRLISPSELEEFRPLIQYRRDRDTGEMCEVLDGLLLKNGYLYKKVSIDSISCHGVMPKEEELLKFKPSGDFESDNLEWLTQLYGEPKKKRLARNGKGGEKGESSSGLGLETCLELYNLVCIGRKDFGMIVGMEKDDSYKILKQRAEAPIVLTVDRKELKDGPSDMKFTALDCHKKTISTNDTVKVLEGPLKDRQGLVKQIYRGVIFMYNENETENGGYFCANAQMCEKIKLSFDASYEKGGNSGFVDFEDIPSSPKSPLSPKKTWEMKENKRGFNQEGKDGMFTVGQTLRIRVGPLKGYLCNVLAVRYSDVTVKLGSQQKVLTVKPEHLSEVRGKSSSIPTSDDPGSSSFKPFDLLGGGGDSRDWTDGVGTSTAGTGWNTGGLSAESSAWPSFPTSSFTLQSESNSGNPSSFPDGEPKKDVEDSSWAAAAANNKNATDGDQVGGWGKSENCWNKAASGSGVIASDGWNTEVLASKDLAGSSRNSGDNWENPKVRNSLDTAVAWDSGRSVAGKPTDSWGDAAAGKNNSVSWGKNENSVETGSWKKNRSTAADVWDHKKTEEGENSWGKAVEAHGKGVAQEDAWGAAASKWNSNDSSGGSREEGKKSSFASEKPIEVWGSANAAGWSQPQAENSDKAKGWMKDKVDPANPTVNWDHEKAIGKDSSCSATFKTVGEDSSGWDKQKVSSADAGSSWNNQQGQSSWDKQKGSSWNKQHGKCGDSSLSKQDGGSSWSRQSGGSSWNKQEGDKESSGWDTSKSSEEKSGWNDRRTFDRGSAKEWNESEGGKGRSNNMDGGSSWNKPDGGQLRSSWDTSESSQEKSGWNGGKAFNGGSAKEWGGSAIGKGGSNAADGNENSSWEKKGTWNSGTSNVNQECSWAQKSNWNSSSGNVNQESGWGKKTSWSSGYGNANQDSAAEDQTSTYSNRAGSGNWRDNFEGRSDRGGFRGRGRGFGDRNSSDREGFGEGGRSDRGGFRGRGRSERGGFRGRDSSDRGGYRGRGGSYREGFGGRGRGRGQSGGWNNNNDSGGDRTQDWRNGSSNSSSWKNENGGSSWNQGSSDKDKKSNASGWNQTSQGEDHSGSGSGASQNLGNNWNKLQGSSVQGGGWGSQGSDWGKGAGDANRTGDWGKTWNVSGAADGGQSSSWNKPNTAKEGGPITNSWQKESGSSWESSKEQLNWNRGANSGVASESPLTRANQSSEAVGGGTKAERGAPSDSWGKASAGCWGNNSDGGNSSEGSGWGRGTGSGDAGTSANQAKPWNQSNAAGQSSGWSSKGAEADGEQSDNWGKASGSSWEGGSKGGGW